METFILHIAKLIAGMIKHIKISRVINQNQF